MNKHLPHDLKQMQSLPLEAKIVMTQQRIKVWFESWVKYTIFNSKTKKTRFVTHTEEPNENGCFIKRKKKVNGENVEVDELVKGTKLKPTEYIEAAEDGQVYVAFSGGKDSTVLADLTARFCKRYGYALYLLFVNTGLEYPEIQKFVKTFAEWLRNTYEIEVHLEILRPEMRFDEVIKKYGYPAISKEISEVIYSVRNSKPGKTKTVRAKRLNGEWLDNNGNKSQFNCENWKFMLDAPFEVANHCCSVMKKSPSAKYSSQTGRKQIVATMAHESRLRYQKWIQNGCNAFNSKKPTSQPMSFWTEQDVLHYIKKFSIPYCSVYGDIHVKPYADAEEGQINVIDYLGCYEPEDVLETTGCDRTGCIFCMFGCHLEKEPNRFQRLKETHPRQYEYCIGGGEMVDGKWQPNKEGLGLGKVLDYIGVKYD